MCLDRIESCPMLTQQIMDTLERKGHLGGHGRKSRKLVKACENTEIQELIVRQKQVLEDIPFLDHGEGLLCEIDRGNDSLDIKHQNFGSCMNRVNNLLWVPRQVRKLRENRKKKQGIL